MPPGHYKRTEKHLEQLCLARAARTEETREKMRRAMTGKKLGPWTEEQKARHSIAQKKRWQEYPLTAETSARITASHLGLKDSDETRAKKSASLRGKEKTQGHKDKLAIVAVHNWMGGQTADNFAAVLCPAGFVREHHVYYGEHNQKTGFGLRRACYQLDFAHIEGKINIELDGPRHKATSEEDAVRDDVLRDLGWRVIRIRHD